MTSMQGASIQGVWAHLRRYAVALIFVMASTAAQGESAETVRDPFEGLNRSIFEFNLVVDRNLLRPISRGYRAVVPEPFQGAVSNILRALRAPVTVLGSLMQGNVEGAVAETMGVGMTIITLGFLNPIPEQPEDWGQTFASWGIGEGPYLVLPLIGPSSMRHTVGRVGDYFSNPITHIVRNNDWEAYGYARYGVGAVDERSKTLEASEDLEATSLDFYAVVRSLYWQNRQKLINNAGGSKAPPGRRASR